MLRFRKRDNLTRVMLPVLGALAVLQCSRGSESPDASGRSATTQPVATAPATAESRPVSATQPGLTWQPPSPPAANERVQERNRMVETQIARPGDFRTPITDERVLQAMRAVPRHAFVPLLRRQHAYADYPLRIGHGQTISQPYIVALMTELLGLKPGEKVLEIGTGSGYQAAVLAHLTPYVYTIELVKPLAEQAQRTLRQQGYVNVHCRCGDGYLGWPEVAPFDAIIVTCAAGHLPEPLWEQLKPGGRIVMPLGEPHGNQYLVVYTKMPDGKRDTETVIPVRFVPLVREPK